MRTDLILTEENDFLIEDNDFVLGSSNAQHGRLILQTKRGDWTQYPKVGSALIQYLKGTFDGEARRDIKLQFEADGYKIDTFSFNPYTGLLDLNFN